MRTFNTIPLAIIPVSCLLFAFISSCETRQCGNNPELLKGSWQSSHFWDGYTEIEISDSLRCYVDHGEYVGPTVAEAFIAQNDSLLRVENGLKYRLCIKDSSTIELTDPLGRRHELRRFQPSLKISDWTKDRDSIFDAQFLFRKKDFLNKP